MNKLNNKLLCIALVFSLMMAISHVWVIMQYRKVVEDNQIKQVEVVVYKNEIQKLQERLGYNLDENQNMTGYTNFLESQNKMLMYKNAEEEIE